MTAADLLSLLAEASLAASAAILLVLALRRPLRLGFGASVAYAAWGVVAAAIVAVLLPAATVTLPAAAQVAAGGAMADAPATALAPAFDPAPWLVLAWLAGAAAMAARLVAQQRAFLRALGPVRLRHDGAHVASATAGLPAVVGVWRPRIVLPADFESRYTPGQQRLLWMHEQAHLRRGDPWVNLAVALLRVLSWFNPLVHLAARCFRNDQELACDQRVLARHPGARRAYGEAMFNTQLAAQLPPLGCQWGIDHPLKERIQMLGRPMVTASRRRMGAALLCALVGTAGFAAWAAQPARVEHAHDATPPQATVMTPPAYPAAAVASGTTGKVVLVLDIGADGVPTAAEVESADPPGVFDAAAIEAAMGWRFSPAIEDGKAVPSQVRVPVEFEPDPPAAAPGATGAHAPPLYPAQALAGRVEGKVVLLVDIDAAGAVLDVAVESSEPAGVFDANAIAAARTWRFEPEVKDGRPVPSRVRVPVAFELDAPAAQ